MRKKGTKVVRVDVEPELVDRLDRVCEDRAFGYKSHILRRAIQAIVMQEEAYREKAERLKRDRELDELAGAQE